MKKPKQRARPEKPQVAPQEVEFEKPFVFLVFGVVAGSVVSAGCVHGLIRPFKPHTFGSVLFLLVFALLSAWMAYQYGRAVAQRVRKWRSRR